MIDDRSTAKGGMMSLSIFLLLFVSLFVFFYINYDAYVEVVYSVKHQRNVDKGWAATIVGWGYFVIPITAVMILLLGLSKDFKKVGLGINLDEIFINKDFIRSTAIPYANIESVHETENTIDLKLKDYTALINNQSFLLKPIARSKYGKEDAMISLDKADFEEGQSNDVFTFIQSRMNT